MKFSKSLAVALSSLLGFLFLFVAKDVVLTSQKCQLVEDYEVCEVKHVIDGDTIELADGRRVRYIGIDTPETVSPSSPVECYGKEASNLNKELVEGKTVRLEPDITDKDKYGRLLRYVYSDDTMINEYLVAKGAAKAKAYKPDIKHQAKLKQIEEVAKANKVGLWGACPDPAKL